MEQDYRTWWRKGKEVWHVTREIMKVMPAIDADALLSMDNYDMDCLLEQMWAEEIGLVSPMVPVSMEDASYEDLPDMLSD